MIKEFMQWLHGLKLTEKVHALLILIILIILLENIAPFIEWKILIDVLHDWLTRNFPLLWRLFFWSAVLMVMYGFFLQEKLPAFFKRFNFEVINSHRIIAVLLTGIIEGLVIFYFWNDLKTSMNEVGGEDPRWLGSFITMLAAAPVALFIWSFRNEDKRKDLQHTEENIRQADFHKIEEWATTFPAATEQETTPEKKNEGYSAKPKTDDSKASTLQIAAIYQLLPYLKGEYGDRFIRPTTEIYRSLLSSWQWSEAEQSLIENGEYDEIIQPAYITALHNIFNQETEFLKTFHVQDFCTKNNWVPLKNIDIKVINFAQKDLSGIKLECAILNGAIFKMASLNKANLERANLKWAFLKGANLKEVNLKEANLKGANLEGASLKGANLEGAILEGAILEGEIPEGTYLIKKSLEAENLIITGEIFKGFMLRGVYLERKNPEGRYVIKLTFGNRNNNSFYTEASVIETMFVIEYLEKKIPEGICLIKTSLEEANLKGAYLRGAHLERVNLESANLESANLESANLKGANLKGANLEGANLEGANLEGAILERTSLVGANLKGVNLTRTAYDDEEIRKTIMNEDTILRDGSNWKPPEDDSDQKPD